MCPSPSAFQHERLEVYSAALDFISLMHEIVAALPRARSVLSDQLERAAISIALNTAEGSGEFSPNEKARFYRMALRSAAECAAILDVAQRVGALSLKHEHTGKELLRRIAAMLTALIHRHKSR